MNFLNSWSENHGAETNESTNQQPNSDPHDVTLYFYFLGDGH